MKVCFYPSIGVLGNRIGVSLLRVSKVEKVLPGLSVSDSWKRIFPGTSMSNKWICSEGIGDHAHETQGNFQTTFSSNQINITCRRSSRNNITFILIWETWWNLIENVINKCQFVSSTLALWRVFYETLKLVYKPGGSGLVHKWEKKMLIELLNKMIERLQQCQGCIFVRQTFSQH